MGIGKHSLRGDGRFGLSCGVFPFIRSIKHIAVLLRRYLGKYLYVPSYVLCYVLFKFNIRHYKLKGGRDTYHQMDQYVTAIFLSSVQFCWLFFRFDYSKKSKTKRINKNREVVAMVLVLCFVSYNKNARWKNV